MAAHIYDSLVQRKGGAANHLLCGSLPGFRPECFLLPTTNTTLFQKNTNIPHFPLCSKTISYFCKPFLAFPALNDINLVSSAPSKAWLVALSGRV